MKRLWAPLPPPMQRTLRDDAKWLVAYLGGVLIAHVVFGVGDGSLVLSFVITAVAIVLVLNVLRRLRRGRPT